MTCFITPMKRQVGALTCTKGLIRQWKGIFRLNDRWQWPGSSVEFNTFYFPYSSHVLSGSFRGLQWLESFANLTLGIMTIICFSLAKTLLEKLSDRLLVLGTLDKNTKINSSIEGNAECVRFAVRFAITRPQWLMAELSVAEKKH